MSTIVDVRRLKVKKCSITTQLHVQRDIRTYSCEGLLHYASFPNVHNFTHRY